MKELPLSKPALQALYQKIGGEEGLRSMLRDFYARMAKDVMIGFYFVGHDTNVIADRQHDFLSRAMGANPSYQGLPPAQAHSKLPPILTGHFDRRLRILEETLKDHGMVAEDIRIWVDFENSFRAGIVT
jgi:hemoglobin